MLALTNHELAVRFFIQVAIILVVCHLLGLVMRRMGQPHVIAEMIGGIVLGPSLFGLFWPDLFTQAFPPESMRILFVVSQLGLACYMFVVGLEFRFDIVRGHARSAIAVSIAGMVMPFALGALLGWYLHRNTSLFPAQTPLMPAMFFLGASLCITAFPMLARIIQFKKLNSTTMGSVSLGAGAANDAAAWCLLAFVLASIEGEFTAAGATVGGGIGFVVAALLIVRPLLVRWSRRLEEEGYLSDGAFIGCVILLALGSAFTEAIGLHAVFGAFIIGAIMPRGVMVDGLIERIQPFTVVLLLPLFFTYSGLNTRIGLLDSPYLWGMAGLILAAAIIGKGVACWLAARATGIGHREALGIGTLMNVRGLMELIIINIGLQRGIISPALFAALAIMAVITTVMASPLFDWIMRKGNEGMRE